MRYDTPVFFQSIKSGEYDTNTHNYGEDIITEEKRYASISDTETERLTLIYDKIKQGTKVIKLQIPYTKPFDKIRIGEKVYGVDFDRARKNFVVSEVQ
jgi:hypothetical protein